MRVMLITSQPVVAAGFAAAFPGIEAQSASPHDSSLGSMIASFAPEILLIDFMPEESFGLLMTLRGRFPECWTVLWVRNISADIAYQAVNLGVHGIARTTASLFALEECLKTVACGGSWFDEQSKAAFFEARTVGLTPREAYLVILVSRGLKNKEIAAASSISEATVRIYLSAIFRKLRVKDRYQLALHGLTLLGRRPPGPYREDPVLPRKRGQQILFLEQTEPPCALS